MGIIQRQALKNSLISYFGIFLGVISLLFIQPRFLTKEEIGLTRILFAFSSVIATFMPLGINAITFRYFHYYKNEKERNYGFFGLLVVFPIFIFAISELLLWYFAPDIKSHYKAQSALFVEYYSYVFPLTFFLAYNYILLAYANTIYKTVIPAFINDVLVRIVSVILFTVYFLKLISLNVFIALFVGIYFMQFVSMLFYILIVDKPKLIPDWNVFTIARLKEMAIYGLIMSFAAVASYALKFLDSIMLGAYKPLQAGLNALDIVGIYSIAMFMATFVEAPLNALERIFTPKVANAWANDDKTEILKNYHYSSFYMTVIGVLLFLLINTNIDAIFSLIPDKDYASGKYVVLFISLGTLINMATGNNDSIIWASKKYYYIPLILMTALAFAFVGYQLFIPIFGMNGAAITTFVVSAIANFTKFFVIWKLFGLQPFNTDNLKVILIGVVLFFALYFIQIPVHPILSIIIKSTIIVIVYGYSIYKLNLAPMLFDMIKKYMPESIKQKVF